MPRPGRSAIGLGLAALAFGLASSLGGCGTREEAPSPTISKQEQIFKQLSDNEEAQRKAGKLPRR